jgi:hypothetical protein
VIGRSLSLASSRIRSITARATSFSMSPIRYTSRSRSEVSFRRIVRTASMSSLTRRSFRSRKGTTFDSGERTSGVMGSAAVLRFGAVTPEAAGGTTSS